MELIGYVSAKGSELSAKLLTGTALHITRVTAGSGTTAADDSALAQEQQVLAMSPLLRSGSTVTLPVTLAAALAEQDYTLTEVGVYALDPDEGEILYRIYRLDEPLAIAAGSSLVARFELEETVSAEEIIAECSPAGLVTFGDLAGLQGAPNGLASLDAGGILPVAQLPFTFGTEDLIAGSSPLENGRLYFVYE